MTVDFAFIGALEGRRLAGYVPVDDAGTVEGHSGVTVATGVDLGQDHHGGYIDGHLADAELRAKLAPYFGLRGQDAVDYLASHPLILTGAEADTLDAAVQDGHVAQLTADYDAAERGSGRAGFEALPDPAQTVIASVAFQYGDLAVKCPLFWRAACRQDWNAVVAELDAFGDRYPTRHRKEAALLRTVA